MAEYFKIELYTMLLLIAGFVALLAAIVPVLMEKKHISAPIIYLVIGSIGYFFYMKYDVKPLDHLDIIEHVTEFVILIALTNTGLKIKNPFKWKTWKYSFRLLAIAMPLTIIAAAYLGWYIAGLAPATAILFGALISPTDPVLASELQTSQPSEEDTSTIKLGLTSEAGINDGLAFPFTYFAIMLITMGSDYMQWIGSWVLHEFFLMIIIGLVVGLLSGWGLCKLIFSLTSGDKLSKISRGIISLSLTLLPYALAEIVGGYGFIAVFAAACLFSNFEHYKNHMDSLHDFNEELESYVVALIFISTGVFIAIHYNDFLDAEIISVALIMVLVVRPVAGYLSLIKTDLTGFQKFVLSFYGIRGVGSIYYLSYALLAAEFADKEKLLSITVVTIFLSVLIHGFSARSIQKEILRRNPAENKTQGE